MNSLEKLKNEIQKNPHSINETILNKLKEIGEELDKIIDEDHLLEESKLTKDKLENMSDEEFDKHINRIKLLRDRKDKLNKLKDL